MKKITLTQSINLLVLLFISSLTFAQVGINTTDPKGVLDINSPSLGVVYPNVALLATDNPAPVVNPQGGNIVEGTVVYNTNSTSTGLSTEVFPGIYVWNGSEWVVHYKKRHSELHNQTAVLRSEANYALDWQDVPGLGVSDLKTFTAKYSGLYRIEVKTNFGGGKTESNSSIFVSQASGEFRFLFDGVANDFSTTAFSAYSSYINSGTYYESIWKETSETKYVKLIAGQTYPFSLTFDAFDAPGFIGNGSTSGFTPPASIDLVNEDFEGSYTVVQNHVPDGGCATNGWEVYNTSLRCTACSDNVLLIYSFNNSCTQDATAIINFTPSTTSVDLNFDFGFRERSGRLDTFRVYVHNGVSQVGADLVNINNSGNAHTNSSYSGSISVTPGLTHSIRFEYYNGINKARYASIDNIVISENSGVPGPPSSEGRGYVGNDVDCQIEFTYIGE